MRGQGHKAFLLQLIVFALLVGGCSWLDPQPNTPRAVLPPGAVAGLGEVTAGRTHVGLVDAKSRVVVAPAALKPEEQEALTEWGDFPIAVGVPSEVSVEGGLPPGGVRITRTYTQPLPVDAAATLAFYEPKLGTWLAVPSEVSTDRKSVSAIAQHLSLWTDLVSGTQDAFAQVQRAVTDAADWAYYQVGKVFDTRVDPPECKATKPDWVDSVTFIETHRNNSILFCVGADPEQAGVLTIKARVNRGFGFNAEPKVTQPVWAYNSSYSQSDFDQAVRLLTDIEQVYADAFRNATADGRMTPPGQEYSVGIAEQQARQLDSYLALNMAPQSALPFLITTLGQLLGTDFALKLDGYVAAVMATAKCAKDVDSVEDGAGLTKAALSCVSGVDEQVAQQLALYLLKRGVADPGQLAGKVVGKITVYLALVGPAFNGMNYVAERSLVEAARTVHVFPKLPVPSWVPCTSTARWAVQGSDHYGTAVVAMCGQTLTLVTKQQGSVTWKVYERSAYGACGNSDDGLVGLCVFDARTDTTVHTFNNLGNASVRRVLQVTQRWVK